MIQLNRRFIRNFQATIQKFVYFVKMKFITNELFIK